MGKITTPYDFIHEFTNKFPCLRSLTSILVNATDLAITFGSLS